MSRDDVCLSYLSITLIYTNVLTITVRLEIQVKAVMF